jgi:hypothetical protein
MWGLVAVMFGAFAVYRAIEAGIVAVPDLAIGGMVGAGLVEWMWAGEDDGN